MTPEQEARYRKSLADKQDEVAVTPVYNAVIDFVNTLSRSSQVNAFCRLVLREHRTLQQSLVRLCMAIIRAVGSQIEDQNYDGRNELAVKLCADITKEFDDRMDSLPLI